MLLRYNQLYPCYQKKKPIISIPWIIMKSEATCSPCTKKLRNWKACMVNNVISSPRTTIQLTLGDVSLDHASGSPLHKIELSSRFIRIGLAHGLIHMKVRLQSKYYTGICSHTPPNCYYTQLQPQLFPTPIDPGKASTEPLRHI